MIIDKITVVIKPTNACNLRCKYCYNTYQNYSNQKMDIDIYKKLVSMLARKYRGVKFIWHGGEPMLMGLDFFRTCMEIQDEYRETYLVEFENALQTNATLIDEDWCNFFRKNHFKIGVSFDGPPYGLSGRGGAELALRGMKTLKKNGLKFGAVAVINSKNYLYLDEIYDFFTKEDIPFSYNCVFESESVKESPEIIVSVDEYTAALEKMFDRWIYDTTCQINVSPFWQLVRTLRYGPHKCENIGCMYRFISIDYAGSFYPCGRLYYEDYVLGNIWGVQNLEEIWESQAYEEMVKKTIVRRKNCQKECDLYKYCNGGCNSYAIFAGDLSANHFPECESYYRMLTYVKGKIEAIKEVKDMKVNPGVKKFIYGE